MKNIIISIIFIVVGGIGILKNKVPKWSAGPGFAAEVKFYVFFYLLVIMGVVLFILEISANT